VHNHNYPQLIAAPRPSERLVTALWGLWRYAPEEVKGVEVYMLWAMGSGFTVGEGSGQRMNGAEVGRDGSNEDGAGDPAAVPH